MVILRESALLAK